MHSLSLLIGDPIFLGSFVFYFLAGYLLYAAALVGIGSICNSLKEAQNFMLPITGVLMIPLLALLPIAQDPTETALIPGRPRALAIEREARRGAAERLSRPPVMGGTGGASPTLAATGAELGGPAPAPTREITHTAIVRRRLQQPLCSEEPAGEAEDTVTHAMPPNDPEATQG